MVNRKVLAGALIFLAALIFLKLLIAQPPTFHQFYGYVLDINGTPITTGVMIEAFVNGSVVTTGFSDSNGKYGYSPLYFVQGGRTGDTISFSLDNYFATNYTFAEENITQLNLTYNVSAPSVCVDADEDGYNIDGGVCGLLDCNDANTAIHPGATEICNSVDDNCDGQIDEGCGSSPPSSPSGGGGGGGGSRGTFTLNETRIATVVSQGEGKQVIFKITDSGIGGGNVLVSSADMNMVSNVSAVLPRGGSVSVVVSIIAPADKIPNLYTGHLDVFVNNIKKQIALSVEVQSSSNIFDVFLNIPNNLKVSSGGSFDANLTLTRLTETPTNNVTLNFIIKDASGKSVYSQSDIVNVQNFMEITKTIVVPENVEDGDYNLYVQADYDGKVASASKGFVVASGLFSGQSNADTLWWVLVLGLTVSIVLVIIIIYAVRRKEMELTTPRN
mgnify:CR=1 FL=1